MTARPCISAQAAYSGFYAFTAMPMGALTVHYMARTLRGGATPWSARYTTQR